MCSFKVGEGEVCRNKRARFELPIFSCFRFILFLHVGVAAVTAGAVREAGDWAGI